MKDTITDDDSSRWRIVRSIDRRLMLTVLLACLVFSGGAIAVTSTDTVTFSSDDDRNSRSADDWRGAVIDISTPVSTISGKIYDNSTATQAYLVDMNGNMIESASIESGEFSFSNSSYEGKYRVLQSHDSGWTEAQSFESYPKSSGYLTVENGAFSNDNGSTFDTTSSNFFRSLSVSYTSNEPTIDNASASPSDGELVQDSPVELSINVSDADFGTSQGDEINVTFYNASDDLEIGTDTLTANGTATASWGSLKGGENRWYVRANDSYGNEVTSETFTFNAPADLEIRALDTKELITEDANGDPINVQVQFFGDEGAVAQRNTTDGTISLAGLPVDERFAVTVDAGEGYADRQILIPSLIEHQTAYLLNTSGDIQTVEPRFRLEDPSNQFDTEESEILLERPIEINGTTQFVPIAGDRIGLNGFDTILEAGQRYRVTVRDPESGAQRRLGEFTATASEPVTLTVQDVEFDSVADVSGLDWTARYLENDNSADEIEFIFRDTFETQSLEYEIYERGNDSNVLVQDTATGNITVREPVPSGQNNTVWIVEWETTRTTGEKLSATRQVSSGRLPVGPGLAPEWQTTIAVVGLFVVAGLFGGVNPGVGGIAVATTGGFFWMLNWLPGSTTGLMVLLAFFVAVLSYGARQARGATA